MFGRLSPDSRAAIISVLPNLILTLYRVLKSPCLTNTNALLSAVKDALVVEALLTVLLVLRIKVLSFIVSALSTSLGFVPLGVDETISMLHFFEYFMHGTGHWLGLDVHDAGSNEKNGKPRGFEHGMVTTIEPGIYVRPTKPVIEFPLLERDPVEIRERRKLIGMEKATKIEKEEIKNAKTIRHEIPTEFLGIGVRIEDDIVCTDKGPLNLTEKAPKTIEEIEAVTA